MEYMVGFKIGIGIINQESEILMEILYNREAKIVWDFMEKGVFKPEVKPPYIIPIIKHEPWQAVNFRVPKALEGEVLDIIKKKLECVALERYYRPYQDPWFLISKQSGGYRLINAVQ